MRSIHVATFVPGAIGSTGINKREVGLCAIVSVKLNQTVAEDQGRSVS
ncbi:MAG: hypothetical protein KME27_10050 [Lyngbya sp. HA4199-MV5]|nr:hypothetical protein [Lyngbya sp. HA4199-MV5]